MTWNRIGGLTQLLPFVCLWSTRLSSEDDESTSRSSGSSASCASVLSSANKCLRSGSSLKWIEGSFGAWWSSGERLLGDAEELPVPQRRFEPCRKQHYQSAAASKYGIVTVSYLKKMLLRRDEGGSPLTARHATVLPAPMSSETTRERKSGVGRERRDWVVCMLGRPATARMAQNFAAGTYSGMDGVRRDGSGSTLRAGRSVGLWRIHDKE